MQDIEGAGDWKMIGFGVTRWRYRRTNIRKKSTMTLLETIQQNQRGDYLEVILNNAADGIITLDKDGIILSINPAGSEMLGYEKNELLGQSIRVIQDDTKKHICDLDHHIKTGYVKFIGNGPKEFTAKRKDREIIYLMLSISSVSIGDERVFIGIMRDVTERVESDKRHKRYVTALEEQGMALAQSVKEARQAKMEAIAANKSKSEFLANMSHELRTPLNAVIGFSEVMLSGVFGSLSDRYSEYTGDILKSGKHLLSLINDILDLSKIEAGKVELHKEKIYIEPVFRSCYNLIRERALDKRVKIDLVSDGDVCFIADEVRIKQVLLNLLSNAVKFTEPGGEINVMAREDNGQIYIVVKDTGIGMDEDGLKKAFTLFGQVDGDLTRTQEGTGLGLPLTKKLIELHGGTLEIESKLGVGTTVTVILPKE